MNTPSWYIHYRTLAPDYKDLIARGLPPRQERRTIGPFTAGRAVDERRHLLRLDTVFEAHLSQDPGAPTVAVTRSTYRGTGS